MTRSRATAKQAGTRWESAIVDLASRGWRHAERRAKTGALDKGDITGVPGVVIEAKDVAKISLAEFLREAQVEAENAGALVGAAWIKRAKHHLVRRTSSWTAKPSPIYSERQATDGRVLNRRLHTAGVL